MPIYYLSQVGQFLAELGVDRDLWLKLAEVDESKLNKSVLPYDQYERLIDQAAKLSGRPDIGLLIGRLLKINHHGALGFALMNCMSLHQSMILLQRFIRIRSPLLNVALRDEKTFMDIELEELYDVGKIRTLYLQAAVVTVYDALSFAFDVKEHIDSVSFAFAEPEYTQLFANYFDCPVLFNQSTTALRFNKAHLEDQVTGDPIALEQAQAMCEHELQQLEQQLSLTEQIHDYLMGRHQFGKSLNDISQQLNMTPRTLHRRLAEEGTSFHGIQDDVRATYARHALAHTKRSIKELAYELGYTDVANFRRAFKRWQSQSPQAYRDAMSKPTES